MRLVRGRRCHRRVSGRFDATSTVPVRAQPFATGWSTRFVSISPRFVRHFGVRIETRSERTEVMRYTLLLHYPEPTAEELGAEALAEGMRAFEAYAKALDAAGVLVTADILQRSPRQPPSRSRRRAEGSGRPVRRHQGAAERHVRHRGSGFRRRDRVGEAGTVGGVGSRRDPADRDPLRRRHVAGRKAGKDSG